MYKHKQFGDKIQENIPIIKRPPVKLKDLLKKKRATRVNSIQTRHDPIK